MALAAIVAASVACGGSAPTDQPMTKFESLKISEFNALPVDERCVILGEHFGFATVYRNIAACQLASGLALGDGTMALPGSPAW